MAKRNSKKDQLKVAFVTYFLTALFTIFVLFFVVSQVITFFYSNPLFVVKEVVVDPSLSSLDVNLLDRLKGRSIFSVDLKALQRRLQFQNPYVDQLRVLRKFPDRIYIVAKSRDPFAIVSLRNQDLLIDRDGFALANKVNPSARLPVIVGASFPKGVSVGRVVVSPEVSTALGIIGVFQNNSRLASFGLAQLDVSNLTKIFCTLSNNLKIVIDRDGARQKFQTLEFLLTEGNLKLDEIEYIDLRFKEPVLGKKQK